MSSTIFEKTVTLNAVLYILSKMGGKCDMHKIFKTLYFADMYHLSKYGSSITGDKYIAMEYGPVPSQTDDIFKAVRGDSFFSQYADDLRTYFHFVNKYVVTLDKQCDLDYLSESEVECLDEAIAQCKDKSFKELTDFSHGLAWSNTKRDREISIKDIMRENGDEEGYIDFIVSNMQPQPTF